MKTKFTSLALAAGLLLAPLGAQAIAGAVAPGFDATQLPANDDGSSGVITLPFSVNFYGTTYDSLFVNNNGNFTFNSSSGTFTPFGVGAGYIGQPIIAGFFADVDTRGAGSGLTSWGAGTFDGHEAFGATWPAVGYYNSQTDKLNTFQIILVNRSDVGAGDFDIVLNYDQIQWETGAASGGSDGLGGTSAAVGFSAGTGLPGTFFQFAGSLENGALIDGGPNSLVANSNDGVAGQYLFSVRNGNVIPGTPESSTWVMMGLGFACLGFAGFRKAKSLRTV